LDERYQVPVSFLGAGLVAWPLRVSLFTEPAAALREVINEEESQMIPAGNFWRGEAASLNREKGRRVRMGCDGMAGEKC
jgi:hypothetical protein